MNPPSNEQIIRFSMEDLNLFSRASHDCNPLHLSRDYARKTPYGEPVVFGVLGGLACLGNFPERPESVAESITMEFLGPMLLNVDYRVRMVKNSPEETKAHVHDGRRLVQKVRIRFRKAGAAEGKPEKNGTLAGEEGFAPRTEPADREPEELAAGVTVRGEYRPSRAALAMLGTRFGLFGKGVTESQIAALMWCSYLVGMELPGMQALFSQLTIRFDDSPLPAEPGFTFEASTKRYDARFDLLAIDGRMEAGGRRFADVNLGAFVRQPPPPVTNEAVEKRLPRSEALSGKVALVTGASRGLGAAIARALALQGCTVLVNYHRSHEEAARLKEELADAPGTVVLLPGDAGGPQWCREARERILREYGRLDFLILNAAPSLLPLWLEPDALERIHGFLERSVSLVSVPMAAFLDMLSAHGGTQVLVSSAAVREPVAEWPHYVAAKCAAEGLVRTAALEYPDVRFFIVRPHRLLTDLTNTPLGRRGAVPVETVAATIVQTLIDPPAERGRCVVLENDAVLSSGVRNEV